MSRNSFRSELLTYAHIELEKQDISNALVVFGFYRHKFVVR